MKRIASTLILAASAAAHAGGLFSGPAFSGAMQGAQRQQCIQTCRQGDGQCYQGCASLYPDLSQQRPPPAYQPVPPATYTDYNCVSQCTQQGLQYGLCTQRCSYNQ